VLSISANKDVCIKGKEEKVVVVVVVVACNSIDGLGLKMFCAALAQHT